jgi:maltose phosphorylase
MYLRTARLDLDDYNNDTDDGLHITSMGGTWMAVVMGFGGLRVVDDKLILNPFIPGKWKSYTFRVDFRGAHLSFEIRKDHLIITNFSGVSVPLVVWEDNYTLNKKSKQEFIKEKIK